MAILEITEHDKLMFHQNVRQAVQQKQSIFSAFVHELEFKGKKASYDSIGTTMPERRQGKISNTRFKGIDHFRRWMSCSTWDWATPVTDEDKIATIHDPTNDYVVAAHRGFRRQKDDVILEAMLADVETGEEGGTMKTFASSCTLITESGNDGLTLAKLMTLREAKESADVDDEISWNVGVTPRQMTNLLNTTEIKNADYNTVKALAHGQVNEFMGFNFVRSNRYLWKNGTSTSQIRILPVWTKEGIGLAQPKDLQTRIDQRSDLNYIWQIWCSMMVGALRVEDKYVMAVECKEVLS